MRRLLGASLRCVTIARMVNAITLFQFGPIGFGIIGGVPTASSLKATATHHCQRAGALVAFTCGFVCGLLFAFLITPAAWRFIVAAVAIYLPPLRYLVLSRGDFAE